MVSENVVTATILFAETVRASIIQKEKKKSYPTLSFLNILLKVFLCQIHQEKILELRLLLKKKKSMIATFTILDIDVIPSRRG